MAVVATTGRDRKGNSVSSESKPKGRKAEADTSARDQSGKYMIIITQGQKRIQDEGRVAASDRANHLKSGWVVKPLSCTERIEKPLRAPSTSTCTCATPRHAAHPRGRRHRRPSRASSPNHSNHAADADAALKRHEAARAAEEEEEEPVVALPVAVHRPRRLARGGCCCLARASARTRDVAGMRRLADNRDGDRDKRARRRAREETIGFVREAGECARHTIGFVNCDVMMRGRKVR